MSTPTESADDLVFEAWLHKATMDEVIAHYDRIRERMTALSDEVAEHFLALDRNAALLRRERRPVDAARRAQRRRGSSPG